MEYRDAGKSYGTPEKATAPSTDVYYPSFEMDLLKFPELSKDIGEECVFTVKAMVKSKTLTQDSKCQYMEIRSIGVGESDPEKKEYSNEADKILDVLRTKVKRY